MQEIIAQRAYTAKTFQNGNDLVGHFHAGHIHYKDGIGDFQDVDYRFIDQGTYWELTKASYKLRVAKDFGAPQLLRFDNKYETADHTIYYEPHSLWWINLDQPNQRQKFRDAQSVTGTLVADNTIRWAGAFGAGIHYQVQLQRSGFRKEIIATGPPQNPPYANYGIIVLVKWTGTGLAVKADDQPGDWDVNGYYESDQRFELRQVNGAKSYIQKAYARDSDDRSRKLKVFFERRQNILWQGKLLPKQILEAAIYPIAADTVTSYYAGAGDGYVADNSDASWDTVHDATSGGDDVDDSAVFFSPRVGMQANKFLISRSFIPIDTSGLGAGATISAATLYIWFRGTMKNYDNDGDDFIAVVQTFQASTSALVAGDYEDCGSDDPQQGGQAYAVPVEAHDSGARLDITDITLDQYDTYVLNATGRGWIDKTGTTMLGLREGHDVIDSQFGGSNNQYNQILCSSSEETGTGQDPYLEVTYTAGGNFQSVDGVLTPAGVLVKGSRKNVAGAITAVGVIVKSTSKAFTGSSTSVGVLVKQAQKAFTGATTASGSIIKQTGKVNIGSITAAGTLVRSSTKSFTGSITTVGALVKQTAKSFTGSVTSSGIVSTLKARLLSISGSLTPSGTLIKQTSKTFAGGVTAAGSLVKQTVKSFVGSVTAVGSLATQKITGGYFQVVGGVLTMSGIVTRQTNKIFTGSVTTAGSLIKQTVKAFTGSITAVGALATLRSSFKIIGGAITMSGILVRQTNKQTAGIITMAGSITKHISKTISGVLTAIGTLARQILGLPVPAIRIYAIESENRVYAIEAENRIYSIASENRIYPIPG